MGDVPYEVGAEFTSDTSISAYDTDHEAERSPAADEAARTQSHEPLLKRQKYSGKEHNSKMYPKENLEEEKIICNRSYEPEEERPKIPGYQTEKVETQDLQNLFRLNNAIEGYSVQSSTLHVFVEHPEDKEAALKITENKKNWLKQQGFTDVKVVLVPLKVTDYYYGANIRAGNSKGTLGCFASMKEKTGFDIAAIKINEDTIPRCDMRFKNSDD